MMNEPLLTLTVNDARISQTAPIIRHYCADESLSSLNEKIGSNGPLLTCSYAEDPDQFSEFVKIVDEMDALKFDMTLQKVFSNGTSREISIDVLHNLLDAHRDSAAWVEEMADLEMEDDE